MSNEENKLIKEKRRSQRNRSSVQLSGKKWVAWTTLSIQIATLLSSTLLPVAQAASISRDNEKALTAKQAETLQQTEQERYATYSDKAQTLATVLSQKDSANAASSLVRGAAVNEVNRSVESWLNLYGSARVALNVDAKGGLDGSAADVLFPLYDRESWLLFNSLGLRHIDQRTTGNIGIGGRYFADSWMMGINTFLDNDFTGKNRRFSVGAELGRDFAKISANTYWRISDWHQSRDFVDYDERPANGYDLRFEGWLPIYPQLGGTLAYEKYRGNEVALFGKDHRQKDPSAMTMGINYTPIPLVTLGSNYRSGSGGNNETQFNLQLNYRLGDKWSDHLDSDRVKQTRTLAGSRYDLVDRNNTIVLDYRRNDTVTLDIAPKHSGNASDTLLIKGHVRSKYPLKAIDWDIGPILAAGAKMVQQQSDSIVIMLPAYHYDRDLNANKYVISAVARDEKGNASKRVQTVVEVMPATGSFGAVKVVKNHAIANQIEHNQITAEILDNLGQPLENVEVRFSTSSAALLSSNKALSDAQGKVSVDIRHNKAISVPVTFEVSGKQQTTAVDFIADSTTATFEPGTLLVKQDNAIADGGSFNQVTGRILDAFGNPVAGMKMTLTMTNGATIQGDVITDENGVFVADVFNKKAGEARVTVQVNGQSQELSTTFIADNGSASPTLTLVKDNSAANGTAMNTLQVKVVDANSNDVPAQSITVSASNGAKLKADTVVTNASGVATIEVSNTLAGITNVVIETNGKQRKLDTHFIADVATAKVTDFVVQQNGVVANGSATNTLKAVLKDALNNPIAGEVINFTATNGASIQGSGTASNAQGEVIVAATNLRAGTSKVSAAFNGSQMTQDIQFIADASTAKVDDATFIITRDRAEAGKEANRVSMKVVDANSNPVAGVKVRFSATNGATPANPEVSTDKDGNLSVEINSTKIGTARLTATSGNVLTRDLTFSGISSIEGLDLANGAVRSHQPGAAFPQTGFKSASFNVVVNNLTAAATDFIWSSSDPAVTVNASGKVTINDLPASRTVEISAKDKTTATSLRYSFTIKHWAFVPSPNSDITYSVAKSYCASEGAVLPNSTLLGAKGVRGVGTVFGEWGDLTRLIATLFWSDNSLYHFHQDSAEYHANTGTLYYQTLCIK